MFGEAAAEQPSVKAVGERQVARLITRSTANTLEASAARARGGYGLVAIRWRYRQPVHHRVGDPDRRARGDREGQAFGQARGDLLGSGRAGEPDPGGGHLGAQFVDVDSGHPGAGRAQQPAGELVRRARRRGSGPLWSSTGGSRSSESRRPSSASSQIGSSLRPASSASTMTKLGWCVGRGRAGCGARRARYGRWSCASS